MAKNSNFIMPVEAFFLCRHNMAEIPVSISRHGGNSDYMSIPFSQLECRILALPVKERFERIIADP